MGVGGRSMKVQGKRNAPAGTGPREMGIVPFEQNMLLAIHGSVKLLLTHMRRLVGQKERVVALYLKFESDLAAMTARQAKTQAALNDEILRHDELRRHCRELVEGTSAADAWNVIVRIVRSGQ